jgi:hypothetical protein
VIYIGKGKGVLERGRGPAEGRNKLLYSLFPSIRYLPYTTLEARANKGGSTACMYGVPNEVQVVGGKAVADLILHLSPGINSESQLQLALNTYLTST